MKRKDNQLLVVTHLSQLLTLFTGFTSLLIPIVIWVTQKDKVYQMDKHGKDIINFQLSLLVYALICIPLILLFGLGVLGFIALGLISVAFPIINAIKVNNGEPSRYPLSFNFIN